MDSPVVTAASISVFGVLAAALVSWLMNLSVRERTKAHDVELIRLRAQISEGEARQQREARLDQATHEAQLRERVEFRLKLYGMAAESVASASAAISEAFEGMLQIGRAVQTGEQVPPIGEKVVALLTAGTMLPPSLDEPYRAAIQELGQLHSEVLNAFQKSPGEAARNYSSMVTSRLGQTMGAFRKAAEAWKVEVWAEGKSDNNV